MPHSREDTHGRGAGACTGDFGRSLNSGRREYTLKG